MTGNGQAVRRVRWLSAWRQDVPVLLLFVAAAAVLVVEFPSFYRTTPAASPARAIPNPQPVEPLGISTDIDLGSLDLAVSNPVRGVTPSVSGEAAGSMARTSGDATALLPAGADYGGMYRVIVGTETLIDLSSPQWPSPCVCWMVLLVVDPTPPLALACVAANPPIYSEEVVVLIDAVSGKMLREAFGGGQPWEAGHGCAASGHGLVRRP